MYIFSIFNEKDFFLRIYKVEGRTLQFRVPYFMANLFDIHV